MDTPKRLLDEFPDYVVYLKDEREPTIFKNPAHFFLEPDVIGTPVQDRWVTDADPAKTLTNDVIFRVIPSRADLILQTDAGQFRRSCACACRPRFTHILVDGVPHCPDCRAPWDRQPDAD